ncbi:VQ protein [Dillenia turbinata]|uniref:VQ protein n=1 Tax=Dillenia turbinata TaxID=194707 RepID=A0AAN8Z9W8_9MAGN
MAADVSRNIQRKIPLVRRKIASSHNLMNLEVKPTMAAKTCTVDPVKVVIICTRHVETDPKSFKFVVQSLTGKNSSVQDQVVSPSPKRRKITSSEGLNGDGGGYHNDKKIDAFDETGFFEEQLDTLLLEMPSAEELRRLLHQ